MKDIANAHLSVDMQGVSRSNDDKIIGISPCAILVLENKRDLGVRELLYKLNKDVNGSNLGNFI